MCATPLWVQLTHSQLVTLTQELRGLFGLSLPPPYPGLDNLGTIAADLDRAIGQHAKGSQLRALVAALASDASDPSRSVVTDLSEILFLQRNERSEYQANPGSPGPWVFPKLMLEYATLAGRVDRAVGGIVAPFCARQCPTPPVGCCHHLGYDMGLVPEGMLRIQALEAALRGWSMPERPDVTKCRYHTTSGCTLRLFKSPACLQYLCPPLRVYLDYTLGPEPAEALMDALHRLGQCDIDRTEVFARLQHTATTGERYGDEVEEST